MEVIKTSLDESVRSARVLVPICRADEVRFEGFPDLLTLVAM